MNHKSNAPHRPSEPDARPGPTVLRPAGGPEVAVTCADYHTFVASPASVTDCARRIAIIRHTSVCPECLQLALRLLADLVEPTDAADPHHTAGPVGGG